MARHKKKSAPKFTMKQVLELRKMKAEIKAIKKDVALIKRRVVDPDTIMTARELKEHEKTMEEYRKGKFVPLSKLKKELGWQDARY